MTEWSWQCLGGSAVSRALTEQVRNVATVPWPLLLVGESGTGKTVLARELHGLSGRPGLFVAVSALGLSPGTRLAELNGHVEGAFTGARGSRQGLLETAHKGTFFLDELGTADAELQGLLLRILEDPQVRAVGDARTRPLDVRYIAATNEDLTAAVAAGKFRQDLLYRFGYFVIRVPPLRERRGDIVALTHLLLERYAAELARPVPFLENETAEILEDAEWPGNVRQLASVCQHLLTMTPRGSSINPGCLPESLCPGSYEPGPLTKQAAIQMIEASGGFLKRAARANGISPRNLRRVRNRADRPPTGSD